MARNPPERLFAALGVFFPAAGREDSAGVLERRADDGGERRPRLDHRGEPARGFPEMEEGFALAAAMERPSEPVAHLGIPRRLLDGQPVGLDGPPEIPRIVERHAGAVVRLRAGSAPVGVGDPRRPDRLGIPREQGEDVPVVLQPGEADGGLPVGGGDRGIGALGQQQPDGLGPPPVHRAQERRRPPVGRRVHLGAGLQKEPHRSQMTAHRGPVERGDPVLRRVIHRRAPIEQERHQLLPPEHRRHMERGHAVRRLRVHREAVVERRRHGFEIAVPDRVQHRFQTGIGPRGLRRPGPRAQEKHCRAEDESGGDSKEDRARAGHRRAGGHPGVRRGFHPRSDHRVPHPSRPSPGAPGSATRDRGLGGREDREACGGRGGGETPVVGHQRVQSGKGKGGGKVEGVESPETSIPEVRGGAQHGFFRRREGNPVQHLLRSFEDFGARVHPAERPQHFHLRERTRNPLWMRRQLPPEGRGFGLGRHQFDDGRRIQIDHGPIRRSRRRRRSEPIFPVQQERFAEGGGLLADGRRQVQQVADRPPHPPLGDEPFQRGKGVREREQQGHRTAAVRDFEALPLVDAPQIDAQVLSQLANADL